MSSSGLDEVMVVSEYAVNAAYTSLWQSASRHNIDASLLHGHFGRDDFQATFRALRVRLLSNGNAVILVDIDEGESGTLR